MKRKVWGWILFAVGIFVTRTFWGAITVSRNLSGETNYFIVAAWITFILLCFFGWFMLIIKGKHVKVKS